MFCIIEYSIMLVVIYLFYGEVRIGAALAVALGMFIGWILTQGIKKVIDRVSKSKSDISISGNNNIIILPKGEKSGQYFLTPLVYQKYKENKIKEAMKEENNIY